MRRAGTIRRSLAAALGLLTVWTCAPAGRPAATRPTSPDHLAASPIVAGTPSSAPGPAHLSLDEAVGAVMMVGYQGELSESVVQDWSRHQYGGLLVVNLNHNGQTSSTLRAMIGRLRGVGRRRLLAATDQEGSGVCIALADVPCAAGPAGRAESASMAAALHSLGFDVDLGPVADVCSVPNSIMTGRCYGPSSQVVAAAVGEAVDGIHDGHMLAAAKHFPGHGATTVSSEDRLPTIDAGVAELSERDWPPFRTAAAHGTDLILLGHLYMPALDVRHAASLSPAIVARLRDDIAFRGAILSDDLEMGAITASTPTPEAAVQFLIAGGDMAMVGHHIEVADATFDAIRSAVIDGRLPRSRLDAAVAALEALPSR